jgi:hypothetical protein
MIGMISIIKEENIKVFFFNYGEFLFYLNFYFILILVFCKNFCVYQRP